MKIRILVVLFWGVVCGGIVISGCGGPEGAVQESSSELQPLVVDKDAPLLMDAPLLLEEPNEVGGKKTEAEAKNATCYVCHANYQQEDLAQWHAKNNIGCVDCHGESIGHKNDENHLTAPDKMYAAGEIDEACGKCHTGHDVPAIKIVRRWKERTGDTKTDVLCKECHESHDFPAAQVVRSWQKRTGQKEQAEPIVCTDCHGEHRLKIRSVRY
jgi:formate-dependent nitrite reductase cytochrome c552 subunit